MSNLLSFIAGTFVGVIIGVALMALFASSSSISRYEEAKERCDK